MILHWPQVTQLVAYGIVIGVATAKHGLPRDGKYNSPMAVVSCAIGAAILYFGGFWTGGQP